MRIKSLFNLKLIFSYLSKEKCLGIIKYNKELKNKLDISKYDYLKLFIEKKYLNMIQEKALFNHLNKIINNLDYDKYSNVIKQLEDDYYNDKYIFQFDIKNKNKNTFLIKKNMEINPDHFININELIIDYKGEIKIPISVLKNKNLKSLCLKRSIISFIIDIVNYKENITISMDNIKNLELNNIYIKKDEKIQLSFPNLKYLAIESGHKYSFSFYKNNFGFKFAYIFFRKYVDENGFFKFNFQKDIFDDNTFPKQLEYFKIKSTKIICHSTGRIGYFSKTDQLIEFTKYENGLLKYKNIFYDNDNEIKKKLIEFRFSTNNYDQYFSKQENINLYGSYNYGRWRPIDINEVNKVTFGSVKCYDCDEKKVIKTGKNFIILFKSINSDNFNLNRISFDFIDFRIYPEFIEKIKYMKMLISFKAFKCIISKKQLLNLIKNFSLLELISIIKMNIKKLKLNDKLKNELINIFPKINIKTNKSKNIIINYYDILYSKEDLKDSKKKIYDDDSNDLEEEDSSLEISKIDDDKKYEEKSFNEENESFHWKDEEYMIDEYLDENENEDEEENENEDEEEDENEDEEEDEEKDLKRVEDEDEDEENDEKEELKKKKKDEDEDLDD